MKENIQEKRLVKTNNIFYKIKNFFTKIFFKNTQNENSNKEEIKEKIDTENFIEQIKIDNNDKILCLQKQLKENKIQINELTDKELDELIELYTTQINEKRNKLKEYKIKMKKYLQ